jgi:VanZ family protein
LVILAALAGILFVAWVIRSADEGSLPGFITALYAFPNGDKVGHFLLMGMLALIISLALPRRLRLAGLIVLSALLAIEEFSQQFFTNRHADWLDLACSLAGVALFGGVGGWLIRRKKQ